jgi:hypothetical protein
MNHRWPPSDAAGGNGYGPGPKTPGPRPAPGGFAPIAQERRGRGPRQGSPQPFTLGGRKT